MFFNEFNNSEEIGNDQIKSTYTIGNIDSGLIKQLNACLTDWLTDRNDM